MKSKLQCHADNEREDERTDKRERQRAVVDLAFAFISRTQEKYEEKSGGESCRESKDKQRSLVKNRGIGCSTEYEG